MMSERQQLISLAAYHVRVQGFIKNGFWKTFEHHTPELVFCKLTHRNGRRISVVLDLKDGRLSQL